MALGPRFHGWAGSVRRWPTARGIDGQAGIVSDPTPAEVRSAFDAMPARAKANAGVRSRDVLLVQNIALFGFEIERLGGLGGIGQGFPVFRPETFENRKIQNA